MEGTKFWTVQVRNLSHRQHVMMWVTQSGSRKWIVWVSEWWVRAVELEDEDDGFVYDEDEIAEARGSRPTEDEQLLLEGTPPAPVLDVLKYTPL